MLAKTVGKVVASLLLMLLSVSIASCGGSSSNGSTDSNSAEDASKDPIVYGLAVAETGTGNQFDLPVIASAEIAIDEINEKGGVLGRQVEAVIRDTKSKPEAGALAAQEVIEAGASVVFVSSDFDFGAPAANVAAQQGMVVMSMGAESVKFGVEGIGPRAFTIGIAAPLRSSGAAEWGYESQGWRNAFTLAQDSYAFTLGIEKGFTWAWNELGGKIVGEQTFSTGDTSFAAQINKLKSASPQPDVIFLTGFLPEAPTLIKQIRAAGIDLPILSAESLGNEAWLSTVPGLTDVFSADAGNPAGQDPDPKFNDVMAGIREKVGPDVSIFGLSATGYSAIQAVSIAIERAGTLDADAIVAQLEKFDKQKTLMGPTTYTPETHISLSARIIINEIKDGKLLFKEEWQPRLQPPDSVVESS